MRRDRYLRRAVNFFEQQTHARRRTALYVLLFALATAAIAFATNLVVLCAVSCSSYTRRADPTFSHWLTAHPQTLFWTTLCTLGLVIGASLYRMLSLAKGGGVIAGDLDSMRVDSSASDPHLRQLLNVVEETAIAAGVPVPEVYVLERETGINAFAAGFTTSDAAIAVTRGALTHLTRDELQGVIGHEFSHILNGDTRLNTRLVGVLFGILAVGLTGRLILRAMRVVRDWRFAAMALGPALALMAVGYLGVFFGRMIQAAVSRSRESLADACAVQFTRNPIGLVGALKKIAAFSSSLGASRADEVSHMLIADRGVIVGAMFKTHPPILDRIRAIEPYFSESELKRIRLVPLVEPPTEPTATSAMARVARDSPLSIVASIGQPGAAALVAAADRRAAIPATLADAARMPADAIPLVLAMMLTDRPEERSREIESICKKLALPNDAPARVKALAQEIARLDPINRLPLLQISFPALRRRTPAELRALAAVVEEIARADGKISVFEYALSQLLRLQLYEVLAPRARRAPAIAPKLYALRAEVQALFSALAQAGNSDVRAARAAYDAGVRRLFPMQAPEYGLSSGWGALDRALVRLDFLAPPVKQELIEALVLTVCHDRQLTVGEDELLRVVCASLHCPLPPLAA